MIKDSGDRKEFETGAVRDMHEGKGRCDLLPACAILRLARHYEAGAEKYEERNWEKGIPIHSFIDSAIRHLMKYLDGQVDEDHLCAATWNCMCAMWTEEKRPEMLDIPARKGENVIKSCATCANLIKWCKTVWACKQTNDIVDEKKISKPTNCQNWSSK